MCVLHCPPRRMCVWVSSSVLSAAGCVTSDSRHRRGTGWCVGGICHPHHSWVVSFMEALDFRGPLRCCSASTCYICLPLLCLKQHVVTHETDHFVSTS